MKDFLKMFALMMVLFAACTLVAIAVSPIVEMFDNRIAGLFAAAPIIIIASMALTFLLHKAIDKFF